MAKGPSGINFVSVLLALLAAALLYLGWKLVPPYWMSWDADKVLRDNLNVLYQKTRNVKAGGRLRAADDEVRDQIEERLVDLGIDDPELVVGIEHLPDGLRATADYEVVVELPGLDPLILHFSREATTDTTRIDWDK